MTNAKRHLETDKLQIGGIVWNFAPFGLVFMAKKFLEASRAVIAQEDQLAPPQWHPVGRFLACHSIELSLKAFLALSGENLKEAKAFGHDLSNLLAETETKLLGNTVALTTEERGEILKASVYYNEKVFEYPSLSEAAYAYPKDPNVIHLVAAAEKLVAGLYEPCQKAA